MNSRLDLGLLLWLGQWSKPASKPLPLFLDNKNNDTYISNINSNIIKLRILTYKMDLRKIFINYLKKKKK